MDELRAHGDTLSQWRLRQIEQALEALDQGREQDAMALAARAVMPADRVSRHDRETAIGLESALALESLEAAIAHRRARRSGRS